MTIQTPTLAKLPPDEARAVVYAASIRMKYRTGQHTIPEQSEREELEKTHELWLPALFPQYFTRPFADFHHEYWRWLWSIRKGATVDPFVGIWPRGAAKSTNAEAGCAALASRKRRRYGLYVSGTQDQADDHVGNVATMLESPSIERLYPDVGTRLLSKYGHSRGWRRQRLRTQSGFTLDALGLDKASRGLKIEEDRPDFIVLDDLDDELDTEPITKRKVLRLTRKIIPAGSSDVVVLAMQNLIHPKSIFSQLAGLTEQPADFLLTRSVSGPFKAINDFEYEQRDGRWFVKSGDPTWQGQDLVVCQEIIDLIGISSFLTEYQQEVEDIRGGIFDHIEYQHCEPSEVPDLVRIVVWVDPAVSDTDQSDSHGIQADGIGINDKIYRLFSWEARTSPEDALRRAIRIAIHLKAEAVGVETDQGGDTWRPTFREAARGVVQSFIEAGEPKPRIPLFRAAKAGAGHGPKVHRAQQMLADYETGGIIHVTGTHRVLERALNRFPLRKPLDLTDASYWSWADLREPEFQGLVEYAEDLRISPF